MDWGENHRREESAVAALPTDYANETIPTVPPEARLFFYFSRSFGGDPASPLSPSDRRNGSRKRILASGIVRVLLSRWCVKKTLERNLSRKWK